MPEPDLEDLRQAIIAERLRFRDRVTRVLKAATQDADGLALAIGEISPDQAYDAWVKNLIEQIGSGR